ncbi:DUF2314 domain-containing protein [Caulobacter soli]|uniref:DUF2314 domain-containing protein n=1 Tax=Caulobacter soli TaxID=2708539 RepID=UPI0013EA43B9|nr:DUF2314 domain-containing protein [Caulobacter soli]
MNAAIAEAQEGFPRFKAAVAGQGGGPAIEVALVKYGFAAKTKGAEVEHVFLGDVHAKDGVLWGVVNADPVYTDEVSEGDAVMIEDARVSDWLYVIDGRGIGGFTFKLMWKTFSPLEKAAYRAQPPFLWLAHQLFD